MPEERHRAHEPDQAGVPVDDVPAAGTDEDTPYDQGAGDHIAPEAPYAPERDEGGSTHHLPADMSPGEVPER
ncbi:hypothetical protein EIL87_06160 [Saccharopolyspora rhizosphaerae]|uniref:Uncharacterized protein n=1 Tax=Saccharopolyspora rhizosphaerae TaxID=2492662 RepID=A0A3R8Q4Z2_9PSEU|nr:hypothetical protein [Saccharopolyspora rhizosphaerae]RRO18695.1 hypothetical protein EIL87_06160 [Saccharopolyspora rhizosphaerae]